MGSSTSFEFPEGAKVGTAIERIDTERERLKEMLDLYVAYCREKNFYLACSQKVLLEYSNFEVAEIGIDRSFFAAEDVKKDNNAVGKGSDGNREKEPSLADSASDMEQERRADSAIDMEQEVSEAPSLPKKNKRRVSGGKSAKRKRLRVYESSASCDESDNEEDNTAELERRDPSSYIYEEDANAPAVSHNMDCFPYDKWDKWTVVDGKDLFHHQIRPGEFYLSFKTVEIKSLHVMEYEVDAEVNRMKPRRKIVDFYLNDGNNENLVCALCSALSQNNTFELVASASCRGEVQIRKVRNWKKTDFVNECDRLALMLEQWPKGENDRGFRKCQDEKALLEGIMYAYHQVQ